MSEGGKGTQSGVISGLGVRRIDRGVFYVRTYVVDPGHVEWRRLVFDWYVRRFMACSYGDEWHYDIGHCKTSGSGTGRIVQSH